jgi:putative salt-induced outer membrane protein YdiY
MPAGFARALLAALLLALAAPARAADDEGKDVLILKNGDRITGTIHKVWDNEVYIEPPYADEIKVDLGRIKAIDARRDFEFEFYTGEKFTGRLGLDAQGNQVLVRDGKETPFDLARLEELEEPEEPFDWALRLDANGDRSTGNTDTANFRLQAYGMVRFGDHRHEARYGRDYQSRDQSTQKDETTASYDYNWFFGERWFYTMSIGYERDPTADIDYRVPASAGLGYQFFDDAYRFFKISIGPSYVEESIAGEDSATGAWQWKLDFRHKFYKRKHEFFHREEYLAYAGGTENRVLKTATGVRLEIIDDFYVNLEYDYDHETVPAPGKVKTDERFLIGVGLKLD